MKREPISTLPEKMMKNNEIKKDFELVLNSFVPIYLDEMEKISLMNRVDSKFVFSIDELTGLLKMCQNNYRVLEISGQKNHPYDSLYFDSKDLTLYHDHHRAKLNRYKIRFRTYFSGEKKTFLEVKFKNNKEKTFKKRIATSPIEETLCFLNDEHVAFITKQTPLNALELNPALNVRYNRITLVNKKMNERVTIDTGLTFSFGGKLIQLNRLVIAEVKRNTISEKTEIMEHFKSMRIKEGGLSKYCTGMALIYDDIKKNNFKEKIRTILKINTL